MAKKFKKEALNGFLTIPGPDLCSSFSSKSKAVLQISKIPIKTSNSSNLRGRGGGGGGVSSKI